MTAREIYKKNLPLIEAWANGAELEHHRENCMGWYPVHCPDFGDDQEEFRVKPEAPKTFVHRRPNDLRPVDCGRWPGSAQWAVGDTYLNSWEGVTCPECLKLWPQKPPRGYRLLGPDEPLKVADMVHCKMDGEWDPIEDTSPLDRDFYRSAFDAFARKLPEGKDELSAQRNSAQARVRYLEGQLEACEKENGLLKARLAESKARLIKVCESQLRAVQPNPTPKPPLPDIHDLEVALDYSSSDTGCQLLLGAIGKLVKYLEAKP